MRSLPIVLFFASAFLTFSCTDKKEETSAASPVQFTVMPASATNIKFNNTIVENDSVNLVNNAYAYMGSGVGIGDFNNDGLQDVFFGANQQSSKLYINKGKFIFEDITDKAGLATSGWVTGVSVADVNGDGFDDIYLCLSVDRNGKNRTNKLYINNGKLGFTEQANEYGLADTSYSTQAVFLDYDKDGDLDMYLLNHLMNHTQSNNIVKPDRSGNAQARDKLYRNNGSKTAGGHPVFEDVSFASGIIEDGYGLGVVVSDVNNDNWPDIYVSNDYLANDILWLNNKNGSFTNSIARSIKHQSYSSMGVDANDLNNDGLPDIISLDMMPEDNVRKKMMFSFLNYDRYYMERKAGYEPEYMRNMLQLNNGQRRINDTIVPFFSEVGQYAGISETDWSWSVLMADFDNDGWKDVHITNGLGRDMINSDFITFWATPGAANVSYQEQYKAVLNKLNEYGTVELNNYLYHNNGSLGFTNVAGSSGLNQKAISNGCAYADLDNDGDLDLVVSNINKEAFVFQNEARKSVSDTTNNFLAIKLSGDLLNKNGIGAKVLLYAGGTIQSAEQSPVRGYLSTVDKIIHFGLGKTPTIDSIQVTWPDDRQQTFRNIAVNKLLTASQKDALSKSASPTTIFAHMFTEASQQLGINYTHREAFFYDYGYQQLLPQKFTQLGPFVTDGDINGDGLTDFFVGGAANQSGRFFIQNTNGTFSSKDLLADGQQQEDLGCLLFDADGDKDLDLFINSGGYENSPGSEKNLPRLFLNDGKGNFTEDADALPKTIFTSAQCVAAGDYDGDGDLDLFIGGRVFPQQYPSVPESYLLQNNQGRFTNVTQEVNPALQSLGMVTAAIWTDFDNDRKADLVVTGEYMPVRFFRNNGNTLSELTSATGLNNTHGQWRSLAAADIDNDGDMDLIAGNLGTNNKFRVTPQTPLKLYAKDIDGNGSIDPIMSYHIRNEVGKKAEYPAMSREQLSAQVPSVKKRFLLNADFAKSDINELFKGIERKDMQELLCEDTRSVWLENTGGGKFTLHALPGEAQLAPINSIICQDINNDGAVDLIIAGNEYQTEVMTGRYDASYGLVLKGNGKGIFTPMKPVDTGLIIDGDVKDLKLIRNAKNEKILIAAINDERVKAFLVK